MKLETIKEAVNKKFNLDIAKIQDKETLQMQRKYLVN